MTFCTDLISKPATIQHQPHQAESSSHEQKIINPIPKATFDRRPAEAQNAAAAASEVHIEQ